MQPLELYIHIPFCVKKCAYCDFLSGPAGEKEKEEYVKMLVDEIRNCPDTVQNYRVISIFFGGGTPSLLTGEQIGRLMDTVREIFTLDEDAEITMEMNPGKKYEMHRLIGALLSSELKEQEKLDIIEHEYNIPTSQEFREDVRIMCNLSTGIEERATEKTSEKFILNMYKKGYTLDQIADVAETDVDEVEAIIKKKEPAMA